MNAAWATQRAGRGQRSSEVGVFLLMAAEAMFFAGLLSAFVVFRASAMAWPPLGMPYLPVLDAAGISALLFLSAGLVVWEARAKASRPSLLRLALVLGAAFFLFQGWGGWLLLRGGLGMRPGFYGGLVHLLLGAHSLHVLAGLVWLAWASQTGRRHALKLASWYWLFVTLLWIPIYSALYLW